MKKYLMFSVVLLLSCTKPAPQPVKADGGRTNKPVRQERTERKKVRKVDPGTGNCPFGKPVLTRKGLDTQILKRNVFTLKHDNSRKVPLWVCQRVTREQLGGNEKRAGLRFRPDPKLSKEASAQLANYRRSGYDRGHMAPAGDYTTCREQKGKTFFLSNMAPQKPGLNRLVWARLEAKARTWAQRIGVVYIITGPIFKGETKTIGPGKVAVPSHFYKIVVAKNKGKWKAAGYVLENRKYDRPYAWESYIRTIDRIEEKTGLNFMPNLPDDLEKKLEGAKGRVWE